jgi:hypothetical protein
MYIDKYATFGAPTFLERCCFLRLGDGLCFCAHESGQRCRYAEAIKFGCSFS